MKKLIFILFFASLLTGNYVYAEDPDSDETTPLSAPPEEAAPEEAYIFPVIAPELKVFGGYRFVHFTGDPRVGEFEYLHDSVLAGGEFRFFSFPHRFHLDVDVKNEKDYFGDVSYAYEDIVLFRTINRTLWHNLENITLRGVLNPSAGVSIRDSGVDYGVKSGFTNIFLRFKTHDFPFHVYIDGGLIEREGSQQLRSLLGSGYFNDAVRTSQARDVDWHTKYINVGANSHLGPIEVDYSHGEKRFESGGNNIFYDFYSAAANGPEIIRNEGVFPHNLIPDLKGSSNTIKLHTSYTGRLVASATFSQIGRENRDSGAKADYFIGAGEISWITSPQLAFFVKYRYRDMDVDNPESITFQNVCAPSNNPSNTYHCTILPSISSKTNKVSATVRYRIIKGLVLRGEVSYENIDRQNADRWFIPGSTTKKTATLSADVRPAKNATLSVKYTHKSIDDPATNFEPDRSDEGRASFTWIPFPGLTTLLSYRVTKEKRGSLFFVQEDPVTFADVLVQSPDGREALWNRFLGSVSYLVLKNLSVTASYSYMHDRISQDIAYSDLSGNILFNGGVPEENTAYHYSLDVNYMPKENITLNGGVGYTLSSGGFFPTDLNLIQPVSIASFSDLRTKETVFSLFGEYRFKNGFSAGAQYRYTIFNDALDNPFDDVNDGRAHIILLTLSKRW